MRILLYAFKPFDKYTTNISEKVVRKIKADKNIKKAIFPVKNDKGIFIKEIKRIKPDVILGIGQCGNGKKIRIERRARKGKSKQIVNLKLKSDYNSRIAYDAGKYVCNFSMFEIMKYINNKDIKFAFIHIPYDFNINKAIKFVEKKMREIE